MLTNTTQKKDWASGQTHDKYEQQWQVPRLASAWMFSTRTRVSSTKVCEHELGNDNRRQALSGSQKTKNWLWSLCWRMTGLMLIRSAGLIAVFAPGIFTMKFYRKRVGRVHRVRCGPCPLRDRARPFEVTCPKRPCVLLLVCHSQCKDHADK